MEIDSVKLITEKELMLYFRNSISYLKELIRRHNRTVNMGYSRATKTLIIYCWYENEKSFFKSLYTVLNHEVVEVILADMGIMPNLTIWDLILMTDKVYLINKYHQFLYKLDDYFYENCEID